MDIGIIFSVIKNYPISFVIFPQPLRNQVLLSSVKAVPWFNNTSTVEMLSSVDDWLYEGRTICMDVHV